MRILKCLIVIVSILAIGMPCVWSAEDHRMHQPAEKVVVPEEGRKEKVEQHAPSIEVGDTRKFVKNSPLSAAQEDDWYYYY